MTTHRWPPWPSLRRTPTPTALQARPYVPRRRPARRRRAGPPDVGLAAALLPRARRAPRHRRHRRAVLPRRVLVGGRRLPRRLDVLHPLRLPDHVAAAGRAHHHPHRSNLRAFWGRRLRRLMPASLAALVLVLAVRLVRGQRGPAAQPRRRRHRGAARRGQLALHHLGDQSYADLFAAPSPVLHFWSLAIEEQFYLLYPLMAFVPAGPCCKWDRWRFARALMVLMALLAGRHPLPRLLPRPHLLRHRDPGLRAARRAACSACSSTAAGSPGAWPAPARTARPPRPGRRRSPLAICVWLWIHTAADSDWLYRGGLAAYSLLSCAVILATIIPFGPVVTAHVHGAVLRRIGVLSYGIYVFHWPIFLWLDGDRTGLSIWPLFVAARRRHRRAWRWRRTTCLEIPIRRRQLTDRRALAADLRPRRRRAHRPRRLDHHGRRAQAASSTSPTAEKTLQNLGQRQHHADHRRRRQPAAAAAGQGRRCSATPPRWSWASGSGRGRPGAEPDRGGRRRRLARAAAWAGAGSFRSTDKPVHPPHHHRGLQRLGRHLHRGRSTACTPTSTSCSTRPWDVSDRKIPGDDTWRSFGDPVYDDWFRHEMLDAVDLLSSQGGTGRVAHHPTGEQPARAHRPAQPADPDAARAAARQGRGRRPGRLPDVASTATPRCARTTSTSRPRRPARSPASSSSPSSTRSGSASARPAWPRTTYPPVGRLGPDQV